MTDDLPFSKSKQIARSPGGNRRCATTSQLKADCTCGSCRGSKNRTSGLKAQRKARKALRLNPERYRSKEGNEESWRAALRIEVKSGAQANPVATRYVKARNQSDAARAIGDTRSFAALFIPDGSAPLLVVRVDELYDIVAALVEEWDW